MKIPATFLLCFLCYFSAFPQTKYVSPLGSNGNPGSTSFPWQTIQYSMAHAAAGDTVMILNGNYKEALLLNVNGTAGNFITFRGTSVDSVFVDGTGLNADNLLLIDSNQYAVFENIHFVNNIHNYAVGILIQNQSHDIIIRNCKVSEIAFSANAADSVNSNTNANPLLVYGNNVIPTHNITISNSEVYNCRTGFSEALSLDGYVTQFEISHNRVHDISNIGIDMAGHYGVCPNPANDQAQNGICFGNTVYNCVSPYATAGGIYIDGATNCVIERNIIHHCQWGIEVGCEIVGTTASTITVRNNFIYNNQSAAIAFGGYNYPSGSGKITNCGFYNNSCYHNDTHNQGNGELAITYAENCDVRNNIFYCNAQKRLMYCQSGNAQNNVFDHNCWFSTGGSATSLVDYGGTGYTSFSSYKTGSSQDAHSIFADPAFISTDTLLPNLHITSNSHCIDSGDASIGPKAGQVDIDSNIRFISGKIDIGAQELSGISSIIGTTGKTITVSIEPNPAADYFVVVYPLIGSTKNSTLHVYELSGKEVLTGPLVDERTVFKRFNLAGGFYLWAIEGDRELLSTGKLILQ